MYENDRFTFGSWLKRRRRELDWTQEELARRVYCAEITIRKIEANHLRPSRQLADLILKAVQVAPPERVDAVEWARGDFK